MLKGLVLRSNKLRENRIQIGGGSNHPKVLAAPSISTFKVQELEDTVTNNCPISVRQRTSLIPTITN